MEEVNIRAIQETEKKHVAGHMSHAVTKARTFLAEGISNTIALKQDATWCV